MVELPWRRAAQRWAAAYAAAARRASLAGLPPTWSGVGDLDLFYEEDCRYAERLTAANVPCQLDGVRGAPHGFEALARRLPATRAFVAAQLAWLRRTLGTEGADRR